MRKIYIVDETGATFEFNHQTKTLLVNLSGLGIERDNSYLSFENVYKLAKREYPIGSISGTLIFKERYDGYTKFLNYIKKSKSPLRLYYQADGLKYAYVELRSLGKTEINQGVLQCEVVFDKLSMWLRRLTQTIEVTANSLDKIYPYTYPFSYSISFTGEIDVVNAGCVRAPIRVEIIGKTKNPKVEILKNDKVISTLRLVLETNDVTDIIVVDAEVTKQEMTLIEGNKTTDIYDLQDFNYDNFLFLELGNYQIRFDPGVTESTICKISYIEMYEGN